MPSGQPAKCRSICPACVLFWSCFQETVKMSLTAGDMWETSCSRRRGPLDVAFANGGSFRHIFVSRSSPRPVEYLRVADATS